MFKQLFWKFLPRYGMKKSYNSQSRMENDIRTLFVLCKYKSISVYMMGYPTIHVDPRGKCGAIGKILCYQKSLHETWICVGKHKKAYIQGMNCKKDSRLPCVEI